MSRFEAMDGNTATAEAMRQINPDVVAAYPITPQTNVVQVFSQFVADGEVDTEFVRVESEHSAMAACIGASTAGGRVMTATSSNGLAFMWEMVYIAASNRSPIVMAVANRALSGPINIHCDHSDSMGARDAGWVQLFGENPQEAYDNAIQAVRIAEHDDVLLPVMSMYDGFITSHGLERVQIEEDEAVRDFIGPFKAHEPLLDVDHPVTYGPLDFYDFFMEHKRQQVEGMKQAHRVIPEVAADFEKRFGRRYGFFEEYRLDGAELALVVLSSTAGTAKSVVDDLRSQGLKVGLLKPRVFRPFPSEELADALRDKAVIGVMDRSDSFGALGGPLFMELAAACKTHDVPAKMVDYVFGLGGRDTTPDQIETVFQDMAAIAETGEVKQLVTYLGVRE
ncbi:MAG TPA: pyruvate ferredoxin oxidoreductase [Anaerolineae bacterium]|nr:pyruvate ferredoxin oxidoreductase [Anaerolineae bacterium]